MIIPSLTHVRVHDLCLFGHHGVHEEETRLGQRFYVSLEVRADLSVAIAGDDYTQAVCYGELCQSAERVFQAGPCKLIETLAGRIGTAVLADCPAVQDVSVTVRKPSAPVPHAVEDVSVTVTQQREYRVGFSLGANLGEREAVLRAAVEALGHQPGLEIEAVSSFYDSAPWGVEDQPPFVNIAALGRTVLPPQAVLGLCKEIERSLGRVPGRRWGERAVDVDLLFHGDGTVCHPLLTLPHRHLFDRAFVLEPLAELEPELEIAGRSVKEALAGLDRIAGDVTRRRPGQGG
ncbi:MULTISPECIES: 2-amino-4-hydroxy-6-hydroxymethyldihydropteridine diphosphokinase [Acetobacteraceae]|uniref:2-amino-4-hydroxy-6- hydroxymethyldihydropteridine diphosphokinase n=1 Tax=Acetobacteraceae TaxID=433 RepID=UPI0020124E5C|nr:2-amino-4-hydroxy-6-hydroxymethyldihydropteridine diphosphokinase [Bombella apis]MCL1515980.1 folate biosynthesis protein [Parasaccharibacter sp. TMW2.1890]